ncbi:MAG: Unknown protein [uncultured Thiotrichaceae bacterium]|uniref:DUF4255 domain-containing protein n=1 Tax=uncultured Thiotrichaceae bacterium TaxID=298394 RepID=A0A6S6SP05_9GAMM|nr:MAG: Unknown protein [uncultured Thiotrichaceae bacterium]
MSFDRISLQLSEWANTVLNGPTVSLSRPGALSDSDSPWVSLYLFQLQESTLRSTHNRNEYQTLLRYLVTVHGGDDQESHRLLGDLFIAASQTDLFDISQEMLPYDFWTAMHIPPIPSFIIEILYTQSKPQKPAKPVKELIIDTQQLD